jgi:iron complex outermembrane receptor protein
MATCAVVASLAAPGAALAQEAGASSAGEIIVTAQRRSERLEDVPAAITVLNQELLEKAGVQSTTDIARVTPGVTMAFYGGFLQPAIRGITSTGANLGENSNVAMYIDGVYQPQQVATLIDLPDIEQVEVLKGPQGALYGQNATGGAILVRSLSPSFTPKGKFSASYGNYNDMQLRGYISGPLGEGVATSVAGSFQDRDGFRRHVLTGQRDKGLKSYVLRGKFLVEPTETLSIGVTGFYSWRRDSAMYAGFPINGNSIAHGVDLTGLLGPASGPFFPLPTVPRVTSDKQFAADPDVFTRIRSYGGNLKIDWDTGAGSLTSTSGLVKNNTTYLADVDAAPTRIGEARAGPLTGKYFVQDVNFASAEMGIVSFLVGGFFLKGNETFQQNIFEGFVTSLPPAPKTSLFLLTTFGRVEKNILAGYAEINIQPTERLFLTAGGRYTREKQRTFSNSVLGVPQPVISEYPRDPVTFKKFTPRVTVRYEVGPSASIYGSWGRGFKSGVVNPGDFTRDPVKPETIDSYEIGFKGEVAPSLRMNVSAFYYDYKNLQAVRWSPPLYITENAAKARVKGAEFDFQWTATPELTVSGGATYLDAYYVSFPTASTFQPTGSGNLNIVENLKGSPLLRSPKFSGNLTFNYESEIDAGKLGAFVSFYYNSGFGMELSNRIRQEKYASIDAELSFAPSGLEGIRFALWGKNLTDKAIYASVLASSLSDAGSYTPPRTFGIRAEYAF